MARALLVLNLVIALVVVAAAQPVGTLLVIALLVVPAAIGRLLSARVLPMAVIGTVATALAGYLGLVLSYQASVNCGIRLAGGATVVLGSSPFTRWPTALLDRARAAGHPVGALDLLVLVLIEAVVITALPAIGTILALSLVVAPAAAARLWTDRLARMTALAVVIGLVSALGGLWLSSAFDVAAGGAIGLLAACAFVVSLLATRVLARS